MLKVTGKIADIVKLAKTPAEAAAKLDDEIKAAKAAGASADEIAMLEKARDEQLAKTGKDGVHVAPRPLRTHAEVLGKSEGGPGKWEQSPKRSKGEEYQEQISGVERGAEYTVDGTRFDGYDSQRGVLLDAKDWEGYAPADAGFWHNNALKEVRKQIDAANGTPIEWHFSTQKAKDAVDAMFRNERLSEITTVVTPKI
jgi:hypothetical protein